MNLQWLRSFISSADYSSFTRAAQASFITPTALIQQINLLERDIGFTLFKRSSKGITLTLAGEEFYKAATRVLGILDETCEICGRLEKGSDNIIKIAYSSEQFPTALADLCVAYSEIHETKYQFVSIPLRDELSAIAKGTVDMCLIAEPKESFLVQLSFFPLYEDTYSFFMSPNNPLATKRNISGSELEDVEISCAYFDYMKQSFEDGLGPYCKHLKHIEDQYNLSTRMECYMTDKIIVAHTSWREQYIGLLAIVESDISAGRVGAVYRSDDSKRVERFLQYLRDMADELM